MNERIGSIYLFCCCVSVDDLVVFLHHDCKGNCRSKLCENVVRNEKDAPNKLAVALDVENVLPSTAANVEVDSSRNNVCNNEYDTENKRMLSIVLIEHNNPLHIKKQTAHQ